MHICLALKSWLGCVLMQAGRLSFPGPMQIWASCASPSAAAAGAEAQKAKAGGYEAGWGRTVSFGGFILCRIKKGKMELDPLKSLRKASEAVGVTEPAVCEQVYAPAIQGRFLLGFLCITPTRSQTQQKYPFLQGSSVFNSAPPSKVLLDGASPSAAKGGWRFVLPCCGAQPQGEPGRLTQLQPPARPWVRDQDGDQAGKTSGQLCPGRSQHGNLWTKCSQLGTGNKFAPCCRSEKDLTHPKDGPSRSSPHRQRPMKEINFHYSSQLLLTESYFLLGACWPQPLEMGNSTLKPAGTYFTDQSPSCLSVFLREFFLWETGGSWGWKKELCQSF